MGSIGSTAARMELIHRQVHPGSIHGWHTCKLLRYGDDLYAFAIAPDPPDFMRRDQEELWSLQKAMIFHRTPDGVWSHEATLDPRVYSMCVAPDGTFWFGAARFYPYTEVYRTTRPLDFRSIEKVHEGSCAYLTASIDGGGNFLTMYAHDVYQMKFGVPAIMHAAYYDRHADSWYVSSFETPEGRYGYQGMLVDGRRAVGVINSAVSDPKANPVPAHYSWRHVRIVSCDDLTEGRWTSIPWLMPEYGNTALRDLVRRPDGCLYLSYSASAGTTLEQVQGKPMRHHIARIRPDLSVEVFETGLLTDTELLETDSKGRWYLVGRPTGGAQLHLWALDPAHGFSPIREWAIEGTEKFRGYVVYTLRPERFGGRGDGDRVHLLSAGTDLDAAGQPSRFADYWYGSFDLPAGQAL